MSVVVTETDIKRSICELLERFPNRILFTVTPPKRTKYSSKFMVAGWPDIYGVDKMLGARPMPFFIEVKKPGGTLRIEQHRVLEQAKKMGCIAIVATCIEDVRSALGI